MEANLKIDLINKVNNDQWFNELELGRLAQDPTMNYKSKLTLMSGILEELAINNAKLGLIEQYFTPPQVQPKSNTGPQVQSQPLPGQSHGE